MEITDTGKGIAPEAMNTLFDPGFAREGSRVRAGIGLFTARNIMQQHLGEVRVSSAEGKGAVFTVVLPRDLDADRLAQPREPQPEARSSGHRCSALE